MGLQAGDLKNMMYDIFEVDSYASKMGDDKNIVTLSFSVMEKAAADDLMNFLEKGYILEIVDGVKELSNIDDFKFRYYKGFKSKSVTEEELTATIPNDPANYGLRVDETNLDNYKNFFSNSFVESVNLLENKLTIKKAFADPIKFELIDFGERTEVYSNIKETLDIMESYPEVLYLTKYLGDYNISKYGDKLVFENKDKALVLKRI